MTLARSLVLAVLMAVLLVGMQPASSQRALFAAMASPVQASTRDDGSARTAAADERQATEVLGHLGATYTHLDDVTVTMGLTPNSEEAVSYYMDRRIVISRTHSVDIDVILAHEIWHIIDWRDNGRIDWGEDLPPGNSGDYLRR